jgi:serine protease SohB
MMFMSSQRKKPTLGEKLGLQAAQMADALVPLIMNKV